MTDYIFNKKTSFLFARPSFIEGVARVVDLGTTLQVYNESRNAEEADTKALKKDWEAVGQDILNSVKEYESKQPTAAA